MLLAPEWFFVAEGKAFYKPQEYAFIKRRLEQATDGLDMLLIPGSIARLDEEGHYRNTALVISGGETLLEYSKQWDGGDWGFAHRNNMEWKAGEEKGLFSWRGYEAGIEICADHGILKKKDRQSRLDLQFVVACGMYLNPSDFSVAEGGIALLCDGEWPRHMIMQAARPHDLHLITEEYNSVRLRDDTELRRYKIPLPRTAGLSID